MINSETVTTNPYVGPRTFSEAQSKLFFGREREARDLLARVLSEHLLLFYAQSGAGKSSLLHTRLIPQLRNDKGFRVLPVGRVSGELPPGLDTVQNIFVFNLLAHIDEGDDLTRLTHVTLAEFLVQLVYRSNHWIYDAAATPAPQPAPGQVGGQRYALIIDQFEEIFTSHPARWAERENFFRQLDQAMQADPNLWVVLTLREEYVAALDPYAPLLTDRLRARFYMEHMDVTAALAAIQEPAKVAGRPFAPSVAEALVQDLSRIKILGQTSAQLGQYVEPVQLQVVCYQLWENLAHKRPPVAGAIGYAYITANDVQEAGDVDTALARFYEETVASVLAAAETTISEWQLRTWFDNKLITPAGTRNLVLQEAAETGGLPNAVVHQLQKLFLVRAESRAGGAWVELVHDRFIKPIQQANRAWFARHQNPLTQAAQAWQAANRDSQLLYSGQALQDALAELNRNLEIYGDLEREFLDAGRKAEADHARQRLRQLAIGATLLGIVLLTLTSWALWSWNDARQAQATAMVEATRALQAQATAVAEATRALQAEATAKAEGVRANKAEAQMELQVLSSRAELLTSNGVTSIAEKPPLALLLAVEGLRVQSAQGQPVAEKALKNARQILSQTGGLPLPGRADSMTALAFSPKLGRWLAAGAEDGTVRLWDMHKPAAEPRVLYAHLDRVTILAFSPDAHWLATGSHDGTTRLWDMNQFEAQPQVLRGYEGGITVLAFSPDGQWLVTGATEGATRLWHMHDLMAQPQVQHSHEGSITALAFSPNKGRWLVTASVEGAVQLWDMNKPMAKPQLIGKHAAGITAIAFSPTGRWLVTGAADNTVQLWNIEEKGGLDLPGHEASITAAAFSADEQWLITGGADGMARPWKMKLLAKPYNLPQKPVVTDERGRTVSLPVTPSEIMTAQGWPVRQPKIPLEPPLHDHKGSIKAVAFSPDGHWLVTGSEDHTILLYNLGEFEGGEREIETILLYNLGELEARGEREIEPQVWRGHEAGIAAMVFSPYNGGWLATGATDGTVRLWDIAEFASAPQLLSMAGDGNSVKELMARACAKAGRNLSLEEWGEHLEPKELYRKTCDEWPVHNTLLAVSRNDAEAYLKDGNIVGAIQLYPVRLSTKLAAGVDATTEISDELADIWVEIGVKAAEDRDVKKAEAAFVAAKQFDPHLEIESVTYAQTRAVQAYNTRGDTSYYQDKYDEAIADYTQAIKLDPTDAYAYNGRGNVYYYLDKYNEAIADYTEAIELKYDPLQLPYFYLGLVYHNQQKYDEAIINYTEVIKLDSSYVYAFNNRGNAYYNLQEYEKAIADYNRAIELDPTAAYAYNGLGDVYSAQGNYAKAIDIYNKAIELDSSYVYAFDNRGSAYYNLQEYEKAIADYNSAIELDPTDVYAYNGLGNVYAGQRNYAKAIDTYNKVIEIDDTFVYAYTGLGNVYAAESKYSEAITSYTKAIELDDSYVDAYSGRGAAYVGQGKYDEATADYDKAFAKAIELKYDERSRAYLYISRANAYGKAAQDALALHNLDTAIKLNPENADTHGSLCWWASLAGQAQMVVQTACERAVELAPNNVYIRDSRGLARALTGDNAGALADFQTFVAWGEQNRVSDELLNKRREWIRQLEAGQNPFDKATLAQLRKE